MNHTQVGLSSGRLCTEDWPQLLTSPSWHYILCSPHVIIHICQKWLKGGTWLHYFKIYELGYSKSISSTLLSFSYFSHRITIGKAKKGQNFTLTSYLPVLRNFSFSVTLQPWTLILNLQVSSSFLAKINVLNFSKVCNPHPQHFFSKYPISINSVLMNIL